MLSRKARYHIHYRQEFSLLCKNCVRISSRSSAGILMYLHCEYEHKEDIGAISDGSIGSGTSRSYDKVLNCNRGNIS